MHHSAVVALSAPSPFRIIRAEHPTHQRAPIPDAPTQRGQQAEALRNRLLRRVDWRFLLPEGEPACIAVIGESDLQAAVVAAFPGAAFDDSERAADLVVTDRVDPSALVRAFRRLRPGGHIVVDVPRGMARGAGRRLRATGFAGIEAFARWPSRRRTKAWIRLGESREATYFLRRHPHPARAIRRRALNAIWLPLSHRLLRWGFWMRPCLVGRRPIEAEADGCTGRVLLTGGPRSTSRVLSLAYPSSDSPAPEIVKMARVPESEDRLVREADALVFVRDIGDRCRAPHSIRVNCGVTPKRAAEEFVTGLPLDAIVSAESIEPIASRMAVWLARLARETARPAADTAAVRGAPWLDLFRRNFGGVVETGAIGETERLLADCALPVVVEHRDLGPWNVLAEGSQWFVLDWEVADPEGFPLLDLIYFVSNLSFIHQRSLEPSRRLSAYRRQLDPDRLEGRLRARVLGEYAALFALDTASIRAARALHWVIHSASEHRALTADLGRTPPADVLRRCHTISLWMAELEALRREAAVGG